MYNLSHLGTCFGQGGERWYVVRQFGTDDLGLVPLVNYVVVVEYL